MNTWVNGTIINIKHWTNQLFSLIVRAPIDIFLAGQFTKIKMKINHTIIQRAYSYLNSPDNPNLEFYITTVLNGKLTPLLHRLQVGENILLTKQAYGKFTLNEIPKNCINLWMVSSGTGIAPYLSILNSLDKRLKNFSNIILIHATRYAKNLNYLPQITQLKNYYHEKLHVQIILSQDTFPSSLYGHIPSLIKDGILEKKIGLNLNADNSHIMLCGNPNMIYDTKNILYKKYKMQIQSKKNPGNITQERYW